MKYQLNLLKIILNNTSAETVEKLSSNEGFFCSELVANAYIYMGLLPKETSGAHYFPLHFTAEKSLKWKEGVSLGEEYIVDFI